MKKAKIFKVLRDVVMAVMVAGCGNHQEKILEEYTPLEDAVSDIASLKAHFVEKNFSDVEGAIEYATLLYDKVVPGSRATEQHFQTELLSQDVLRVIEEMRNVRPDGGDSPEDLRICLKRVVEESDLQKGSQEYDILLLSVDVAIEVVYYTMELQAPQAVLCGFWDTAWKVVKCVAGTVGSAGIGGLTCAGAGTVTLPVIGTVSGAVVGMWCGAMVGVASFC